MIVATGHSPLDLPGTPRAPATMADSTGFWRGTSTSVAATSKPLLVPPLASLPLERPVKGYMSSNTYSQSTQRAAPSHARANNSRVGPRKTHGDTHRSAGQTLAKALEREKQEASKKWGLVTRVGKLSSAFRPVVTAGRDVSASFKLVIAAMAASVSAIAPIFTALSHDYLYAISTCPPAFQALSPSLVSGAPLFDLVLNLVYCCLSHDQPSAPCGKTWHQLVQENFGRRRQNDIASPRFSATFSALEQLPLVSAYLASHLPTCEDEALLRTHPHVDIAMVVLRSRLFQEDAARFPASKIFNSDLLTPVAERFKNGIEVTIPRRVTPSVCSAIDRCMQTSTAAQAWQALPASIRKSVCSLMAGVLMKAHIVDGPTDTAGLLAEVSKLSSNDSNLARLVSCSCCF